MPKKPDDRSQNEPTDAEIIGLTIATGADVAKERLGLRRPTFDEIARELAEQAPAAAPDRER
ncbi:MAG TPA: hypothetical protein VHG72_10385 [Polyangia bacterium]|nr:hypothetical protein [Polyangia bacterium]